MVLMVAGAAFWALVLKIVEFYRPHPPLHDKYATKAELAKMERRIETVAKERQASVAGLHAKIDTIEKAVTKTEEKADLTYAQVHEINVQIHNLTREISRLQGKVES